MSRVRENVPPPTPQLSMAPEGDAKPYEVFVQLDRGKPHIHAGTLDATDGQMAMQFAREHYGQDQKCVHIWVVPREAMIGTDYDKDVIWRPTDRSYRYARGYPDVRKKWEKFRSGKEVDEYQKQDLKETF